MFQNDFSAGWVPSDDRVNGRRNGLLAMTNCELDQNGAVALAGGTAKIGSAYPSAAHSLFSSYTGGVKRRYLALNNGAVFRDGSNLGLSGSTAKAAFGAFGNYTLICSGNNRVKDTGSAISNLGISAPNSAPVVAPQASDNIEVTGNLTSAVLLAAEGAIVSSSASQINIDTSSTTFNAKIENVFTNVDSLTYGGGNYGTNEDIFSFAFQCEDPELLTSVRFELLLETPSSAGAPVDNYYYFQWDNVSVNGRNQFNQGKNSWSIIQCLRGQFERAGADATIAWQHIKGFRFTIQGTGEISCALTDAVFSGGTEAVLDGTYEYAQLFVENNGSYITRSVLSPSTGEITVPKTPVLITPTNPSTANPANEVWIVRRGGTLGGDWYVVKQLNSATGFAAFNDVLDDDYVRQLNLKVNPFTKTVQFVDTPDDIFDMSGPIRGRMVYMTVNSLLISEENSPGTYDIRQIVKFSGNGSEKGYWIQKVGENVILIGTTKEVYILSGTWQELPDGYLDIYFRPLGVSQPPISFDSCVYSGRVIYMANDGWRALTPNGETTLLTSPNVDRLYRKQTCYGYSPTNISPFSSVRYSCAVGRDKLWCISPTLDGNRRLDVYDFTRQYWRPVNLNPNLVASEEDGALVAFFGDDSFLREIDVQSNKTLDGATGQAVRLLWTVRSGENPRARNDSYTFKAKINTGGQPVTWNVYKNESTSPIVIGTNTTSSLQETFIDISVSVGVAQSWQIELTGAALSELVLTDWSLDYAPRPNPVTFLRSHATNLGRAARKRFNRWPWQLDPRGGFVTLTPTVDGSPLSPQVFTGNEKKTFFYEFPANTIGTDIAWTRSSASLFEEFQGEAQPEIEWVRPVAVKHWELDYSNLGGAGTKRFSAWPFVFDPRGTVITVTPTVDGVVQASQTFTGAVKDTFVYQFAAGVEGVDIKWNFTAPGLFEYFAEDSGRLNPTIDWVRDTPVLQEQIGPIELFRLGKLKDIEITLIPSGTEFSGSLVFDNLAPQPFGPIACIPGKEIAYMHGLPKTTEGQILYINLSSASTFVRRRVRILTQVSGNQSDGRWIVWSKG